jgi:hypothetical protein
MRDEIARLFATDGPFVTVYLDARSDQPQAQQQLLTRWKTVRSQLEAEGATDDDLAAIDEVVVSQTHVGGDTFAAVAAGGRCLLARHLPEPPNSDAGYLGLLPRPGTLLETAQTLLPHLVVLVDRTGADVYGFTASGESVEQEIVGDKQGPIVTRNPPGGWSQRRFQQRAVNAWEENAQEVADEVVSLAKQVDARLVVVGGDVHAVRLLREHLPDEIGQVAELEGGSRHPGSDVDHEAEGVKRLVDTVVAAETTEILREFREEKGQHDRFADGPARVFEALQAATVETLLVHDDPADGRTAWFGPGASHLALSRTDLESMGVEHPREGRLIDVALKAALQTSAEVRIVPSATVNDGLGAILRHTGTTPAHP